MVQLRPRLLIGPIGILIACFVYGLRSVQVFRTLSQLDIGYYHASFEDDQQQQHKEEEATTTSLSSELSMPTIPPISPIDICFITSIYAASPELADRPNDFSQFQLTNTTSFQFFLYTNLEELEAPGWTKIIKTFDYRRFITQSRWGKFMAWKDPETERCKTIFYFDGHFKPVVTGDKLLELSESIHKSNGGLIQRLHPESSKRSALKEFRKILRARKDVKKNVDASIAWLKDQEDFHDNCTLYENSEFGYDPTNPHFQQVAQFFWDRYSQELDSWRDQPLWCYSVQHLDMEPLIFQSRAFKPVNNRMGHKKHTYTDEADSNANAKLKHDNNNTVDSEKSKADANAAVKDVAVVTASSVDAALPANTVH